MSSTHTVSQGEHLSRIAAQYGFINYQLIWDHPQNAQLRTLRQSPNILLPGDALFIPDKENKVVSIETTRIHSFVLPGRRLLLRIAVEDFHERPVTNVPVELEVEGAVAQRQTDGSGTVEQEIPNNAEIGVLRTPDLHFPIKIGYLNPIDAETGWQARLLNLGYLNSAGPYNDSDELASALEEFQCDHGLPLSGQPDSATLDALQAVYGC